MLPRGQALDAFGQSRLVVRDELVRACVARLSKLAPELPPLIGEVLQFRKPTGRLAEPELLARASGRVAACSQALNVLEQMTRERVVEDPQVVRRRLQRFRLRVPGKRRVTTPEVDA